MRFAHLSDCHLGGWRQPELREMNTKSFRFAINSCIKNQVDFVLITGDIFDSAYPSIEILEESFVQLKKLKDKGIACYYIAGSHDYSASGKTFLTVLGKAGFCQNVYNPEEKEGKKRGKKGKQVYLNPILHENVALYGYPGKKSGMEVQEMKNIKLQGSPGLFRILALHTTIERAAKDLPIETIKEEDLPEAEYYAMGHLHIKHEDGKFVYAGPTFPNNFQELEELKNGSFYIIETSPFEIERKEIKLKDVITFEFEISNALTATEEILSKLNKSNLEDKIVLLKIFGKLDVGKTGNINFKEIENFCKDKGAFTTLKSTSQLKVEEPEFDMEIEDMDELEHEIIKKYEKENPSKFNELILPLINSLSTEKKEEETNDSFESRIEEDSNKILGIEDDN